MQKPILSAMWVAIFAAIAASILIAATAAEPRDFRFAMLGDRTGETQPGVYERVWQQVGALRPAFVISVGDTIQGLDDASAESQWQEVHRLLAPFARFPLYLAPGNHDIWSEDSERLFTKHSGHPPHYGFDYAQAHFTVLDNSRTEELPDGELAFLEQDLKAHASQPLKFVISHRPSWVFHTLMRNPNFPLHRLARQYGVQYVIAGHIHQLQHYTLDGIEYVSLPGAGGHLRSSAKYEDGWFFGYTTVEVRKIVEVRKNEAELRVHDLDGHTTALSDWGPLGLLTH